MKKIIYYGKVPNWKLRKHYNKCKEKETTEKYEEAMLALKDIVESSFTNEIRIPEGVTKISTGKLVVNGVEKIYLPDSVATVDPDSIGGRGLSFLSIGEGCVNLYKCIASSLEYTESFTLVVKAKTPPSLGTNAGRTIFPSSYHNPVVIYVPDESLNLYRNNLYWASMAQGKENIKPLSEFIE